MPELAAELALSTTSSLHTTAQAVQARLAGELSQASAPIASAAGSAAPGPGSQSAGSRACPRAPGSRARGHKRVRGCIRGISRAQGARRVPLQDTTPAAGVRAMLGGHGDLEQKQGRAGENSALEPVGGQGSRSRPGCLTPACTGMPGARVSCGPLVDLSLAGHLEHPCSSLTDHMDQHRLGLDTRTVMLHLEAQWPMRYCACATSRSI